MTTSDSINEIAAALAKAQGEIQGAVKDSANPFFKSKYADLSSVWEACRGPLTKHGLAVVQSPEWDGSRVTVETMLTHSSGQWMRGTASASPKEDTPQAVGSVVTYLRRYALQSFVGVAPEDDDAEAAQGRAVVAAKAKAAPAGFDDWLTDLASVAEEGMARLSSTWKASKEEYRDHLNTVYPKNLDGLKAIAAKADAQRKKQPVLA